VQQILGSMQRALPEGTLHSMAFGCGCRHPVEAGAEAREWRLHPKVVELFG